MFSMGLMQGRLTPSRGRGIQFFPSGTGEWQKEFDTAARLGLSHIEWVCEPSNPLFEKEGQDELHAMVKKTGVTVRHMDLHETLTKTDIATYSDETFQNICAAMRDIGGACVEAPLVEASSLLDERAYASRVAALKRLHACARTCNVPVAVETDLGPETLALLAKELPGVGIVYDSGNSAGLGYDMEEELRAYGERISHVHIKDKKKGGTTVPLGEGDVDFKKLFALLRGLSYTGPITLQAARGEDGKEEETIRGYIEFITNAYEQSI